jgi:hypothetical protein
VQNKNLKYTEKPLNLVPKVFNLWQKLVKYDKLFDFYGILNRPNIHCPASIAQVASIKGKT